jgi:GNAT superfamily N-acetyltransferase
MAWTLTSDAGRYLASAGGLLRARPADNTVILSAVAAVQAAGPAVFGEAPPLFGWWQDGDDGATAAFMHTPPFPVVLTSLPPGASAELARELAARERYPAGVNATAATGQAFAADWQARTGVLSRVLRRSRLFRLGKLDPPSPAPDGRARVAGAAERELLISWVRAFGREIGEEGDVERAVDERLGHGGLTLWETAEGPVSLAGHTRPAGGQVRIGPVYTPAACRGRGFGGAVTAAVSQALLDVGAGEVVLFTDLANPTSNALYQRLGYQAVSDWLMIRFGT